MFEINTRTLQRWLYEYKKDGDLQRKTNLLFIQNRRKTCKIHLESVEKRAIYHKS